MDLKITEFPFGAQPSVPQPSISIFSNLGEAGIRNLVSNHYNLIIESPIKHLFPPKGSALEQAKQRSGDFFIQRLGGPDYYNQNRGKPMLTKRHEPFSITPKARKVWLDCYRILLPELPMDKESITMLWNFLDAFSMWMVNTDPNE